MMTHNHVNYQVRLDFAHKILEERFGFQATIVPIQYDPECPFKYNNFAYLVSLVSASPATNVINARPPQPGTVSIPHGATDFILRLTKSDAEGMHRATRVENEVATISMVSEALCNFQPPVVPRIYGWESAASGQGWILQELMPGEPLDEAFESMALDEKRRIFDQMAGLLKGLQDFSMPDTVKGFGGVTFEGSGAIVSAAMPTVGAGPWSSFEESFRGRLEVALAEADKNRYIKGWRANGLRERLEAFIAKGVSQQLEALGPRADRVIVHADFTTNNLLFDPISGRITALLDFDFATISHPAYEFLCSFGGEGCQFPGWMADEESEMAALWDAKLHGFPSPLPETKDGGSVNWEVAKAWEDALEGAGVKTPRDIEGIEGVANFETILRSILPWRVTNEDILRRQAEEAIVQYREENEELLDKLLQHLGW